MSYTYDTSYTASTTNWKKGRDGHKVEGITIHHWGASKTLDFYGIVKFLCSSRPSNPTSAHYVVQGRDQNMKSDRRVACIVDPEDTAYHAGNWTANLTEIGIECRPFPTDADYDVIAELVAKLRSVYGNVPLYPHKHWTSTACPGEIDVAKIDRLAKAKAAGINTTPPKETDMALGTDDVKVLANTDNVFNCPDRFKGKGNDFWSLNSYQRVTLNNVYSVGDGVAALSGKVDGLTALVKQVLAATGKISDAQLQSVIDATSKAARDGASTALATLDATVTIAPARGA
jgi:hypothetical protein